MHINFCITIIVGYSLKLVPRLTDLSTYTRQEGEPRTHSHANYVLPFINHTMYIEKIGNYWLVLDKLDYLS